jgi:hypothetical protein
LINKFLVKREMSEKTKKIEILFLRISKSILPLNHLTFKSIQTQSITKMSRQSNNNRSNKGAKVAPAPQPYCAHCFNLKKPESVYKSHFLRASPDPKSAVVCPELLATNCRYCFKNGHTVGACPVLAEKKREEERFEKQKEREARLKQQSIEQKKQAEVKKQQNKGSFAALFDESSDDEEMTLKVSSKVSKKPTNISSKIETFEEKFPALPTKSASVAAAPKLMNYAGMAAKSKSEYENEQYLKSKMMKRVEMPVLKRSERVNEAIVPGPVADFWADWSENDDEVEYAINQITAREEKEKKPLLRASDLNWAMSDSDSDDEDW